MNPERPGFVHPSSFILPMNWTVSSPWGSRKIANELAMPTPTVLRNPLMFEEPTFAEQPSLLRRIGQSIAILLLPALVGFYFLGQCVLRQQQQAMAAEQAGAVAATAAAAPAADNRRRAAPELDGGAAWLNTAGPLRLRDLRGKIVLLDFWTL